MMQMKTLTAISMPALLLALTGSAQATTVGFVGAAANNVDIPVNYASNVVADGAGWTVSDGTGATPDVTLNWGGGGAGGTGWDWEAHNASSFHFIDALNAGGAWDAANPPLTNAVAQLQDRQIGYIQLQFQVTPGVALVLNSFDLGNATDQIPAEGPYGFDIDLIKDSDASVVWSHSTPLWDVEAVPRIAREESIAVGYTGDLGESYTLRFIRTGGGSGVIYRSGLDNLSFGQVPEPASLALLSLGVVALASRRR
jgi:hypothetical protein